MPADITVEADAFGRTLEQLLGRVADGVKQNVVPTVEESLKVGQDAWKKNARAVLSKSYSRGGWGKVGRDAVRVKSGPHKGQVKEGWRGKTIKTGKYARTIRHHMLSTGEETEGEIGSSSMPGLAHLLEKGHGFFPAAPHVHIEPAAEEAFADFEKRVDRAVEEAIDDA